MSGDHPRVRGEKIKAVAFGADGKGSPPRARGKGEIAGIAVVQSGITPACAGKRTTTSAKSA